MSKLPALAGYLNVRELGHVGLYTGAAALVTLLSTLAADAYAVFPQPIVATAIVAVITSIMATATRLRDGLKPNPLP